MVEDNSQDRSITMNDYVRKNQNDGNLYKLLKTYMLNHVFFNFEEVADKKKHIYINTFEEAIPKLE